MGRGAGWDAHSVPDSPYSRGEAGRLGVQAFQRATPRHRRLICLMVLAVLVVPFVGAAISALL